MIEYLMMKIGHAEMLMVLPIIENTAILFCVSWEARVPQRVRAVLAGTAAFNFPSNPCVRFGRFVLDRSCIVALLTSLLDL